MDKQFFYILLSYGIAIGLLTGLGIKVFWQYRRIEFLSKQKGDKDETPLS